jgi:uncharacterized protein
MSGSLHAWYSLRDLESLANREVALDGELDMRLLTRLKGLLHSDVGSVKAELLFRQRRDGWLGVELDYQAAVELVCQRCLEPFVHELADRVDVVVADVDSMPATAPEGFEPFELEEGRLQPAQLIEDELIVAIPLVPKHARVEDCGSLARELAERVYTAADRAFWFFEEISSWQFKRAARRPLGATCAVRTTR